jgi:hypothetical protein
MSIGEKVVKRLIQAKANKQSARKANWYIKGKFHILEHALGRHTEEKE